MRDYKLYITGFTSTSGNMLNNYVGTILDNNGKPVYNIPQEVLNGEEHVMDNEVQILAVDGTSVEVKPYHVEVNGKNRAMNVRDFDITFTVELKGSSQAVTTVRLNETAALALINQLDSTVRSGASPS